MTRPGIPETGLNRAGFPGGSRSAVECPDPGRSHPSEREVTLQFGTAHFSTPASQALADRVIAAGYVGMRVRSFAVGTGADDLNLVMWRWSSDRPARIALIDDEGRLGAGSPQLSWVSDGPCSGMHNRCRQHAPSSYMCCSVSEPPRRAHGAIPWRNKRSLLERRRGSLSTCYELEVAEREAVSKQSEIRPTWI